MRGLQAGDAVWYSYIVDLKAVSHRDLRVDHCMLGLGRLIMSALYGIYTRSSLAQERAWTSLGT